MLSSTYTQDRKEPSTEYGSNWIEPNRKQEVGRAMERPI